VKNFARILLASLVAPLVVPVLIVTFFAALSLTSEETGEAATILFWIGCLAVAASYGFMILLFLPAFLLMRIRGWTSLRHQALSGFIGGVPFGLFLSLWGVSVQLVPGTEPLLAIFLSALVYGGCGLLIGCVFWRVTRLQLTEILKG